MPNQIYIPLGMPDQVEEPLVHQIQDEPLHDDPMHGRFEPLHEEAIIQNRKKLDEAPRPKRFSRTRSQLFLMIMVLTSNNLNLILDLRMIQRHFHKPCEGRSLVYGMMP